MRVEGLLQELRPHVLGELRVVLKEEVLEGVDVLEVVLLRNCCHGIFVFLEVPLLLLLGLGVLRGRWVLRVEVGKCALNELFISVLGRRLPFGFGLVLEVGRLQKGRGSCWRFTSM